MHQIGQIVLLPKFHDIETVENDVHDKSIVF